MKPQAKSPVPARAAARARYDAIVDLEDAELPRRAYTLVKQSYRIDGGVLRPCAPEPLLHDFRDATLVPRFRVGSDFWPEKPATDIVVRGAAHAAPGTAVPAMDVAVSCGAAHKRVRVFGRRVVRFGRDGSPRFGAPAPFERVALVYENAYGGVDRCAAPRAPSAARDLLVSMLDLDDPGMYPRNPFGKGYVVAQGSATELELPELEDPDDLLTEERFVVGDPARWYHQPLPWCFDWQHPLMFPRYVHFGGGCDAWFPGPEDERMPEVRRGFLAAGYRSAHPGGVGRRFFQEGSYGLVVPSLAAGERVRIEGMHPTGQAVEFDVPTPPSIAFEVDGGRSDAAVRTHSLRCEPADGQVSLVYGATVELPRVFIPAIHKRIPVAVRVDGDAPIAFAAPATIHETLSRAGVL